MNNTDLFPEIITGLPGADIPIKGLHAYLFQGERQQMVFMTFEKDAEIPAHSHEAQWAVVLEGEIELTIAGETRTLRKGDTYFIPRNVVHSAKIKAGYKDLTLFDQKDRYKTKEERGAVDDSVLKEEVWTAVLEMNRCWALEGNTDGLDEYFHENMVALTPADTKLLEGRDACIASWKRFVEAVKILEWKEIDPKIEVFNSGKLAVVTYYYEITFERDGKSFKEEGRDMLTLINENGKWWVVSDQFSSYPEGSGE